MCDRFPRKFDVQTSYKPLNYALGLTFVVNIKFPRATYHTIVPSTEKLYCLIRVQCRLVKTVAALSAEQATSITNSTSIRYYGVPSVHFPSVAKMSCRVPSSTLIFNRYALNLQQARLWFGGVMRTFSTIVANRNVKR